MEPGSRKSGLQPSEHQAPGMSRPHTLNRLGA
jgi:hypothetical protein